MSSLYTEISQAVAEQQQQVQKAAKSAKAGTQSNTATDAAENNTRSKRTVKPTARTVTPNGLSVRTHKAATGPMKPSEDTSARSQHTDTHSTSLFDEMERGVEDNDRPSERYSFEIYSDQKETIVELKYRYEKRTGKRLPKSRIIREALDHYFQQVHDLE